MKLFVVTFHAPTDDGTEDRLADLLAKHYHFLASDVSAGLFFIGVEEGDESTAVLILDHLTSSLDEDSAFTLYVIEMGQSWDAATTETATVQELEKHRPLL